MATLPSPKPSSRDQITDAISVVVPLMCGRAFSPEELAYIRLRIDDIPRGDLAAILRRLGDTADRIGNPIAAIRGAARDMRLDRDQRAEADRLHRGEIERRRRLEARLP